MVSWYLSDFFTILTEIFGNHIITMVRRVWRYLSLFLTITGWYSRRTTTHCFGTRSCLNLLSAPSYWKTSRSWRRIYDVPKRHQIYDNRLRRYLFFFQMFFRECVLYVSYFENCKHKLILHMYKVDTVSTFVSDYTVWVVLQKLKECKQKRKWVISSEQLNFAFLHPASSFRYCKGWDI